MVWVGAQCGIVVDALPGTNHGDTSPCDYCYDGCEQVACGASEYEVDGGGDPPPDVEEWELALEAAYRRAADEERVGTFGQAELKLSQATPAERRRGWLHGRST